MSERKYFFIIQAGGSVSWGNPKKIHAKPKEMLPQNRTGNLNLRQQFLHHFSPVHDFDRSVSGSH